MFLRMLRIIPNQYRPAIFLLLSFFILSCATIEELAPLVDEAAVNLAISSDIDPTLAARGRTIYITSCVRCHSPEPVVGYDLVRWQTKILPDMTERSKLSETDTHALEAYIKLMLQTMK